MTAAGQSRGNVVRGMATAMAAAQSTVASIQWTSVFKASFMLLFIAYPGVSLKVLRLFKCRNIEGAWWLAADMRLRCYDGRWAGFALYGLIMAVLYVVGLPAAVLCILWRRRNKLFGSPTDPAVVTTRETFGFLYADYGPSAWWWEVEELLRKLLLSSVVVLIDEGSPLQVTLAVLVSGWAHVLHAMYKPWGVGSKLYGLQHGALFVTSFVFLMGLLFKVEGVSSSSGTYGALSGVMVALCALFIAAWVAVIGVRVVALWRAMRSVEEKEARDPRSAAAGGARALPSHVNRAREAGGHRSVRSVATKRGGLGRPARVVVDDDLVLSHRDERGPTAKPAVVAAPIDDAAFIVANPVWQLRRLLDSPHAAINADVVGSGGDDAKQAVSRGPRVLLGPLHVARGGVDR
jgi:hypothetical protein